MEVVHNVWNEFVGVLMFLFNGRREEEGEREGGGREREEGGREYSFTGLCFPFVILSSLPSPLSVSLSLPLSSPSSPLLSSPSFSFSHSFSHSFLSS